MNKEGYSYKLFFKRLVKYFIIPYLLLFSMGFFIDDFSAKMKIAFLIVLYFLIIVLSWIVRFFIFLFHLKGIKIFKEGRVLVFQLFKG